MSCHVLSALLFPSFNSLLFFFLLSPPPPPHTHTHTQHTHTHTQAQLVTHLNILSRLLRKRDKHGAAGSQVELSLDVESNRKLRRKFVWYVNNIVHAHLLIFLFIY